MNFLSYIQNDRFFPDLRDRLLLIENSSSYRHSLGRIRMTVDVLVTDATPYDTAWEKTIFKLLEGNSYKMVLFHHPPFGVEVNGEELMGTDFEASAFIRKQLTGVLRKLQTLTEKLVIVSSLPSSYGCERYPYASEQSVLDAWNTLLRTIARKLSCPFCDLQRCMGAATSGSDESVQQMYTILVRLALKHCPLGSSWWEGHIRWFYTLGKRKRKKLIALRRQKMQESSIVPHWNDETDFVTLIRQQGKILLIGDSVTRQLHGPLSRKMKKQIDLLATTKICTDMDNLTKQFEICLQQDVYDLIYYNYGTHDLAKLAPVPLELFERRFRLLISWLSRRCRHLILATSSSWMCASDLSQVDEEKEVFLTAANDIVRRIARENNLVFADMHKWMTGQHYADSLHFTSESKDYQARRLSPLIDSLLAETPS